jgi:hypothetical protein
LLFNEYGDADMYLSAASRAAAEYKAMDPREALQADSALALSRRARDAAKAYLRFAEVFEEVAKVVETLAADVTQAPRQVPGNTAR